MKYSHDLGRPRKKMRWQDFDYAAQGVYFVTIVTYGRVCLFGTIQNDDKVVNDAGEMVLGQYFALEKHNVQCMDVVLMPNHIHFMIYIPKDGATTLPIVMRKFKSVTTMLYCQGVKENGWLPFDQHLWQRSYWDVIVWNGRQFNFIQRHIHLNPQRWNYDAINENHGTDLDDINSSLKRLKQI